MNAQRNVSESNNSQWRGEKRDGIYNETGLLKEWPAEGPRMLWKYDGLGDGHTSPAIAGNRLYITGMTGDNLILYMFDLNGRLLNRKDIGKDWIENNRGPRSTVCVNDGKLYIYSTLGKLVCLDAATLDEVWTKDLFSDFDGRTITWGVTESPLIVGDKIIMTPGGIKYNVVALNKNTGELIWSSPGEGTVSAYCSPQYIDDQDMPIVVTSVFDYIIALNVNTGEKLWSFPRTSEFNNHPNTPLYHNDMIFSPTGDRGGAIMLRMKNGGKSVEKVWENLSVDTQMGGAVRIGEYVYASGHRDRNWFCVDWNTGETKYKVRDIAPCSVISADGMLYCYSEKGTMNLVRPNPDKFKLVSSFSITSGNGTHWAHPVIHQGVLYIRHGDTLMAYKIN
jgi:outer membrane protein assembly factor BamB